MNDPDLSVDILVVAEPALLQVIAKCTHTHNYCFTLCSNIKKATDILGRHSFDMILLDYSNPHILSYDRKIFSGTPLAPLPQYTTDSPEKYLTALSEIIEARLDKIRLTEMNYKKYRRALKESRDKHLFIFNNMLNGLSYYRIITDSSGKPVDYEYLDVNPAYKKMMGLESADLIGRRITEIFPDIRNCGFNWIENFGKVALDGETLKVDKFFEPLGKWFSVHSFCMGNGCFATIFQDITESVISGERLKKSEERFRKIFEQNPLATFTMDLDTLRFVDLNEQMTKIFGYTRGDLIGKNTVDINLWIDMNERTRLADMFAESGSVQNLEIRIRHRNGKQRIVLVSAELIELDGKKYALAMLNDITDLRSYTEKIKLQSNLLDAVGQAVIALDKSGNIIYLNKAAENLYGYTHDEAISRLPTDFNALNPVIINKILKHLEEGKKWIGELPIVKKDKTLFPVLITANPVFDEKGNYTGIISVHNDITEAKKRENNLRFEKERAEAMNRLKSSLLANMSHELRTPLAGIIRFSNILESSSLTSEQSEMVEAINSSSRRLLETLNLLIELSRIEADDFRLSKSEFNLAQALGEELRIFKGASMVKNLDLNVQFIDKDITIKSDRKLFNNIISNLMNNAVKFTGGGSIDVKIMREASTAVIEISNGGREGNIDKMIDTLLEPEEGFSRFEGTGLGLALTKKSVHIMGGSISIKNSSEKNPVFTIRLPVGQN